MFCYYFTIAGLTIGIESRVSIVFQKCMKPFQNCENVKIDLLYKISSKRVQTADTMISKGEYSVLKKENQYIRMKKMFHNGQVRETYLCSDQAGLYDLIIPSEWIEETVLFEKENILDFLALENGFLLNQGFLLHSSFVDWNGNGILFTAPSGTGKSTQADLWKQYESADIYNGDRTVVRKISGVYHGFGSPYAGSSGIYRNESAPIRAIIVLSQGTENQIQRLQGRQAFLSLFRETLMNTWDSAYMENMTDLLMDAATSIPIYHLACRPDQGAVELVRKTLFGK